MSDFAKLCIERAAKTLKVEFIDLDEFSGTATVYTVRHSGNKCEVKVFLRYASKLTGISRRDYFRDLGFDLEENATYMTMHYVAVPVTERGGAQSINTTRGDFVRGNSIQAV